MTAESNDDKKASSENLENTLQSPVESHFALTPVSNSETSSPANGFTSQDCSDLLQQELDKLDILEVEKSKSSNTGSSAEKATSPSALLSPTEEHINMFSRSNSATEEKEQIGDGLQIKKCEDSNPSGEVSVSNPGRSIFFTNVFLQMWTLLDCHFGIPLFDVDANTKICDMILYGGLVEESR